ncbi:BadF/BadG/BcrA/BcrD ATPase family protein [Marinobacterium aestuariivivens]|uniref:BadF/BadG/BcrA/BcrD ATPase family protein n=1 Tax=Marinobacterium aestuariivivens TaxID=1698799 RepID=A0ABW1ZZ54_9GAMM
MIRLIETGLESSPSGRHEYLVGIDGGGTACRARLADMDLRILGTGQAGPANAFLELDRVRQSILEAVTHAVLDAGLSTDDFCRLHVGMALAGGDDPSVRQALTQVPWSFASVCIESDAYGACLGAYEGADGAIQIVGTGSCGLLLQDSRINKVGGHEFPISDLGSGAVLGLEAIRKTLLAHDGVIAPSELTDSIYRQFDGDIDAIVHWSKTALPADYGLFARQLFDCAENGDPLAAAIVEQGVRDVAGLIQALCDRGATRVALMGSVAQRMKPNLQQAFGELIVEPRQDAVYGALLMARDSAGG